MSLKDFRIGIKLTSGFILVVIIFIAVSSFQLYSISNMSKLQDEGAQRADDAVVVTTLREHINEIYSVIADGIINQNLAETKKDFAAIKADTAQDIATLNKLVDTEKEKEI